MRVLTIEDVLLFLDELRLDPTQRHVLRAGGDLLRTATSAGLIEEWGQFGEFIARMRDLREAGLVEWTPASFDRWGDDLAPACVAPTSRLPARLDRLFAAAQRA